MTPGAPRFVTAEEVAALGFAEAADALEAGLANRPAQSLDPVPRSAIELPDEPGGPGHRELLLMPCHGPEGVGVKLVTVARGTRRVAGCRGSRGPTRCSPPVASPHS